MATRNLEDAHIIIKDLLGEACIIVGAGKECIAPPGPLVPPALAVSLQSIASMEIKEEELSLIKMSKRLSNILPKIKNALLANPTQLSQYQSLRDDYDQWIKPIAEIVGIDDDFREIFDAVKSKDLVLANTLWNALRGKIDAIKAEFANWA